MTIINGLPILILVVSIGCSGPRITEQSEIYNHVVEMDRTGSPIDVTNHKALSDIAFKTGHLASIVKNIKEQNNCGSVMIYVHGAPLFENYSFDGIRNKHQDFMSSGNDNKYPIFLKWNGTMLDAYGDHLFRVRQGQDAPIIGPMTAPLYLAADLAKTVALAFPSWVMLLNHVWRTELPHLDFSGIKQEAKRRQLRANSTGSNDGVNVSRTLSASPEISLETLVNGPLGTARLVPQLLIAPFVASFGQAAWTNYRRRTRAAVWRTDEYGQNRGSPSDSPSGALAMLVDGIQKACNSNGGPSFVLIGHSTGAIILAELVNSELKRANDVNFDKIVFLGSAATIDDFNKTIVPYLTSRSGNSSGPTFYSVSLNEYAEGKESYLNIAPFGTLLEWLDNMITRPADLTERVMGKWENVMLAMDTIPKKVQAQVHLKHLPHQREYPQKHERLDDIHAEFHPFKEEDWQVEEGRGCEKRWVCQ